jgi:hypothetical protein
MSKRVGTLGKHVVWYGFSVARTQTDLVVIELMLV